jgi:hypothetical protein
MMGWSPEKEAVHLQGRDRGAPAGKAAPAIVPADARETPAEERQTR